MKAKSLFLVCLGAFAVVKGTAASAAAVEEALPLLFKAASVDNYADYEALSNILGLSYSNFRASTALEQGVENPHVLGVQQEIDLEVTAKTSLSRAIKNATWRGFTPNKEKSQLATLKIYVNISELCITPAEFSTNFSPANRSYTTDLGPLSLERAFPGPRSRAIAATFSEDGCAALITLHQSH